MEVNNVLKLIKNERLKASIQSIVELPYELPYLMTESIRLLDDNNTQLTETDKLSVCYMLDMYFATCFYEYTNESSIESTLRFGKIEIYKVQAPKGLRYATEKEVLHGIKGLIPENIYPAGENIYRYLCLLIWSFSGKQYYIRQAGYKLDYSSDGKILNSFWEILQMSAVQLKEMMDWLKENNLDKALKIIGKMKKAGGYKYAQYESDEIEESITVKQLVYNILNTFPRNSNNLEYRKAMALALAKTQRNRTLTPYEISQLRRVYENYAMDESRDKLITQSRSGEAAKLKDECKLIMENRHGGVLNPNDFVFKIISTLDSYGYTKCSPKQYKYIEDALKKLQAIPEASTRAEVISEDDIDESLVEMYDALGSGLFE